MLNELHGVLLVRQLYWKALQHMVKVEITTTNSVLKTDVLDVKQIY